MLSCLMTLKLQIVSSDSVVCVLGGWWCVGWVVVCV